MPGSTGHLWTRAALASVSFGMSQGTTAGIYDIRQLRGNPCTSSVKGLMQGLPVAHCSHFFPYLFSPYRYLATDKSFTSPFMELVKLLFCSRRSAYSAAAVPEVHPQTWSNGPGSGRLDTETPLLVSERPKNRLADTKTAPWCPAVLTENLFDNGRHQPQMSQPVPIPETHIQ